MKIALIAIAIVSTSCFPVGTTAHWTDNGIKVFYPEGEVVIPSKK